MLQNILFLKKLFIHSRPNLIVFPKIYIASYIYIYIALDLILTKMYCRLQFSNAVFENLFISQPPIETPIFFSRPESNSSLLLLKNVKK